MSAIAPVLYGRGRPYSLNSGCGTIANSAPWPAMMRLNRIDPALTTGRLANGIPAVRQGAAGEAILAQVNAQ